MMLSVGLLNILLSPLYKKQNIKVSHYKQTKNSLTTKPFYELTNTHSHTLIRVELKIHIGLTPPFNKLRLMNRLLYNPSWHHHVELYIWHKPSQGCRSSLLSCQFY
ncbi:hypothetical protein EB796_024160 [Bugula neritina]|uniref:Uncharacterized protein n=1 Tax=Bugula neritina TaxID=10212 RepID=A0A7J7IUQ2_BUGNE|nr:hypothetical protein EB796_024160 [Bugula neritina]